MLQQNEFKDKQDQLGHEINSNILALTKEKQIIAHRHKQIEEYTERINEQLSNQYLLLNIKIRSNINLNSLF